MDQLTVAACIRLQPHITEDELRGTTQTSTVRSDERFQRNSRTCMVKVHIFCFSKQAGGRNENADGQFVTSSSTAFLETRFLRICLFSSTTSSTTSTSVYLRQLMTSQKASFHHAMHDRFYSTLDIHLFMYIAAAWILEKYTITNYQVKAYINLEFVKYVCASCILKTSWGSISLLSVALVTT